MRTLIAFVTLAFTLPAPAGEIAIRWHGQSFFVIQSSLGTKLAIDPHQIDAFGRPTVAADIVLTSHPHSDHSQLTAITNRPTARVFAGVTVQPPATEGGPPRTTWTNINEVVRDTRIRAIPTYHDTTQGMQRGKNAVFVIEVDGLTVCHLGDLGHVLSPEQARQIGPVDVLMIPVGGVYTINGEKAKEVVAQLKPKRLILPMHFGTLGFDDLPPPDEFLDGQPNVERRPKTNEVKLSATDKAPDKPLVLMLGWKRD